MKYRLLRLLEKLAEAGLVLTFTLLVFAAIIVVIPGAAALGEVVYKVASQWLGV